MPNKEKEKRMIGDTRNDRTGDRIATGLSLLEVLVVISLIGLLLQMMLPAIDASREAARRHVCSSHLRQIGMSMQIHHDTYRHFPSGGWHYTWIGEPERGTDRNQPGGWVFNLLGALEQQSLRDEGKFQANDDRTEALTRRCRTVLPLFHCPSRREARAYPQTWNRSPYTVDATLSKPLAWVAKTDYAANVGATVMVEFDPQWPGPKSLAQGDDPGFTWPETKHFDGVIFGRSRIRQRQIRDGLSKTYLVAEKYVDPLHYETGEDWGDNENLYTGFNNDHCRSALSSPQPDQAGMDYRNSFGSAHRSVWQAALCDGAVRALRFDIDHVVHQQMAQRADGASMTADAQAALQLNSSAFDAQRPSGAVQ
jgi:hypothetical protein